MSIFRPSEAGASGGFGLWWYVWLGMWAVHGATTRDTRVTVFLYYFTVLIYLPAVMKSLSRCCPHDGTVLCSTIR